MIISSLNVSLKGLELGISGAVPEQSEWSEPIQDRAIMEFISTLSGLIMKYGGRIVHGSHPSFTPILIKQAITHRKPGERSPLTLVMSDLWAKKLIPSERARIEAAAEFHVTENSMRGLDLDPRVRNHALSNMRPTLVEKMNAMVVVGGKAHAKTELLPGITEELGMAQSRQLPCFVVGGFGGMASIAAKNLGGEQLRNRLPAEAQEELLSSSDIAATINILFSHLAHNPKLFRKDSATGSEGFYPGDGFSAQ